GRVPRPPGRRRADGPRRAARGDRGAPTRRGRRRPRPGSAPPRRGASTRDRRCASGRRSGEVALSPPTGAVSVEAAQHLAGRERPHAVVVFGPERVAERESPLLVT